MTAHARFIENPLFGCIVVFRVHAFAIRPIIIIRFRRFILGHSTFRINTPKLLFSILVPSKIYQAPSFITKFRRSVDSALVQGPVSIKLLQYSFV